MKNNRIIMTYRGDGLADLDHSRCGDTLNLDSSRKEVQLQISDTLGMVRENNARR
jgi:hypothetical protein